MRGAWFSVLPLILSLCPWAFPARSLQAAEADEALEYRLTRVEGSVLYRAAGAPGWISATEGMALNPGDRVKTVAGAKAEIGSEEGDVIELDEKSEFTIDKAGKNDSSFDLTVGRFLFNIIGRPDRKFKIKTPLASVAVRGTEFALYEAEDGTWEGGVIEGKVAVTSEDPQAAKDGEVLIGQEEGFSAARGQKIRRMVGLPPRMALLRPRFSKMRQRRLELKRQWRRDNMRRRREIRQKLQRRTPK